MERRKFLYSALAAASLAAIPAARSSAAATTTARREGSAPMTPSQRQNPMSCNGMVTSPHYLASQAGLDILRRGGTAIDAAVATAATLAVVYPQMCTLGGDNFWLIYDARTGTMKGLNASGRAGEKASIDFYRSRGLSKVRARRGLGLGRGLEVQPVGPGFAAFLRLPAGHGARAGRAGLSRQHVAGLLE